jgi:hypothetical protein
MPRTAGPCLNLSCRNHITGEPMRGPVARSEAARPRRRSLLPESHHGPGEQMMNTKNTKVIRIYRRSRWWPRTRNAHDPESGAGRWSGVRIVGGIRDHG